MGLYSGMKLEVYDTDIRRRLAERSRKQARDFQQRSQIKENYSSAQKLLTQDEDLKERRIDDEWTGNGRNDSLFILEYQNKLSSVVNQGISKTGYWKFVSIWLNDPNRFGSRPELDQILWVKFLVPQYDLPFLRGTPFGLLMTASELDQFRVRMRMPPFAIGPSMGSRKQPLTQDDIKRAMAAFDAMKAHRTNKQVIADVQDDMKLFQEWMQSALSSDLTGKKAVERTLSPLNLLSSNKKAPVTKLKKCPEGHENPLTAKYCGYCDELYRFPDEMICPECGTKALKASQKWCHECGTPMRDEQLSPVQSTDSLSSFSTAPSHRLRESWATILAKYEMDASVIESVAVSLGYVKGEISRSRYLPESSDAFLTLHEHFKPMHLMTSS